MTRYVALFRGINVGKRRVKNDALSKVFDDLGFENVKVLIASGNVLFDADQQAESKLTKTVEDGLANRTVDLLLQRPATAVFDENRQARGPGHPVSRRATPAPPNAERAS